MVCDTYVGQGRHSRVDRIIGSPIDDEAFAPVLADEIRRDLQRAVDDNHLETRSRLAQPGQPCHHLRVAQAILKIEITDAELVSQQGAEIKARDIHTALAHVG